MLVWIDAYWQLHSYSMVVDMDLPDIRIAAAFNGLGNNIYPFQKWLLVGLRTTLHYQLRITIANNGANISYQGLMPVSGLLSTL